ncbi:MAG: HlyD family efflux transporter periplasmic adaptor subunit, partial [Clostridiales bacterium]|nr:HlyD family efflux transporter periplasmic adaptor subunit [Clostridiales bacterium]
IAAISVKENQFVESGTLLAELTDSNLETTITGNRLNLEVKEAQLKILEQKLQTEYNVTAPMDGTITSLDVSEGDQINKGSQLAVLSDLSYLKYESAIDELDIENIQKGQEVGITVAAFPDTKKANLKGAVFDISKEGTVSRSFSSSITTYPVTIRIDDPGKLKLGMNVDGNILIGSASDVLMLPSDAIKTINSKSFVYLKLKAGESAADYKGLAGGGNAGGGFPGDGNSTAGNSGSQNSGSTGNKGSSGSTGRNGNSANNSSSGNSGRNGNSGQSFRMASGQAGAAGMYGQMAQNSSSGKSSSSSDYYANTVLIPVETGLTADGYTEIKSQLLKEGDTVVIPEATTSSSSVNMQNNFGGGPPPF